MGLDTVELVMEVESSFGIRIPDDKATRMHTVADLYAFVLEAVQRVPLLPGCASQHVFHRFRRALMCVAGVPRSAITLDQPLAALLGPRPGTAVWDEIRRHMPAELPGLAYAWWARLLIAAAVTIAAWVTIAAFWTVHPLAGMTIGVLTVLVLAETITYAMPRGAIPRQCATVRHAVLYVLRHYTPPLTAAPADVWLRLQQIIGVQIGVPAADVRPEHRFIEDLGMG